MTSLEKDGGQIAAMFDKLAPRYNLMNRMMTFGQDQGWRRRVVQLAKIEGSMRVLDLATGTGDIALLVRDKHPQSQVTAGDFSEGMMAWGKQRPGGDSVEWCTCDALNMPFEDATFDRIVYGYLLRNVADVDRALQEIKRVLKPGGRMVCLDTTPPKKGLLYPFIQLWMKFGVPTLGRILAGSSGSYSYLTQSTLAFESPASLKAIMEKNDFENVNFETYMFHTIAIHSADKPLS